MTEFTTYPGMSGWGKAQGSDGSAPRAARAARVANPNNAPYSRGNIRETLQTATPASRNSLGSDTPPSKE